MKIKEARKEKDRKNVSIFLLWFSVQTISYSLMVLSPSKFKWWYDTSMIWIAGHCLSSSLAFLLYLRYASHVLEYGSEKSSITTHILTCFLVNVVFCCFFCFLICLFHVLLFFLLFQVFFPFSFFYCFIFSFLFILVHFFLFVLISFHFCSYLFFF